MNKVVEILSKRELESLCNRFMKCELTRLEEKELEYILLNTEADSRLIQETKTIMGIENILSLNKPIKIKKKYHRRLKYSLRIASVIFFALSIPFLIYKYDRHDTKSTYCEVYSHGMAVSQERALVIAQNQIDHIEDFEKKIRQFHSEEQNKIESFVNKFPQRP